MAKRYRIEMDTSINPAGAEGYPTRYFLKDVLGKTELKDYNGEVPEEVRKVSNKLARTLKRLPSGLKRLTLEIVLG